MARAGLVAVVTGMCVVAAAGCSAGGGSSVPKSTTPTVAAAAYGAYGTTTDDAYPDTRKLSPGQARLVGPHFAVQFDRVSFATELTHAQAMNFGYFEDMDHGDMGAMVHGDESDKSDKSEQTGRAGRPERHGSGARR